MTPEQRAERRRERARHLARLRREEGAAGPEARTPTHDPEADRDAAVALLAENRQRRELAAEGDRRHLLALRAAHPEITPLEAERSFRQAVTAILDRDRRVERQQAAAAAFFSRWPA